MSEFTSWKKMEFRRGGKHTVEEIPLAHANTTTLSFNAKAIAVLKEAGLEKGMRIDIYRDGCKFMIMKGDGLALSGGYGTGHAAMEIKSKLLNAELNAIGAKKYDVKRSGEIIYLTPNVDM